MTKNLVWMTVPEGWKSDKAKYIFRQMNRPVRDEDNIVTAFRDGTVTLRSNRRTEGFTNSLKEIGYQGIRKGDLVIHAMDGFAGAIGVSDSDGKSTPVYSVCQPIKPTNNHYYAYLIRFLALNGYIESLARGIRERSTEFRFREFRELELPIPPLHIQNSIVKILDDKVAKINSLISKYQRLIELLKEKQTSLISLAVTGENAGINIRRDNCNQPWLFPLSTGWIRIDLKHISFTKGRIGYENLRADEYTEEGPLLVSSVHFKEGKIEWGKCNHVTRERFEMSPDIILKKDDVLFMKDGALMGKLAYVDELPSEACLNSHLLVIRPLRDSYRPKFLFYVLMSSVFKAYMEQERRGTTFFGFSEQSMGNFHISLPPISEQNKICDFIDQKSEQLLELVNKIEATIDHLREYRDAFISAAVTGKIDARQ
jgi:type I restriction enzyme, S subunit